ncbi:MAG: phosphatase PAP2 family protein [Oscillospiraceae bacterium]|nr:phosphatase PAP2 family protein [Oscillospiraceae bacterium]
MKLLYFLEQIRIPVLDKLMLLVTSLGEETAFLVIALALFWCIHKYMGYYILSVGFVGTLANQFMKLWFRIPRPWILDEHFTIVEQAREAASGYSFPSGHTQCAVGTLCGIAYTAKQKIVRIVCIALAVLVPISRMYLGVHTPLDVGAASLMALALVFAFQPLFGKNSHKRMPILFGVMILLSVAYLIFIECYPFPADLDAHNYASGLKSGYTLFGSLLGLIVVYIVDEKWLHFTTKAVWWVQILKVVGGLALVLCIKSGTKELLNSLMGENIGRAARYFLIVVFAGIVWPSTFRWFSKLGNKE